MKSATSIKSIIIIVEYMHFQFVTQDINLKMNLFITVFFSMYCYHKINLYCLLSAFSSILKMSYNLNIRIKL